MEGNLTIQFKVTGYTGVEEKILHLRNANRDGVKTREYFDWRYGEPGDNPEPRIFWLCDENGSEKGMAAILFRKYWVNGKPIHFAVLGDISLDQSLRGKGFGKQLLQYVNQYIENSVPDSPGFVIPTEAAMKSLTSIDWKVAGQLIPHVFMVNPSDKLAGIIKSRRLARMIASLYARLLLGLIKKRLNPDFSLQIVQTPDESFETLWKEFNKENLILRDRGRISLFWRYNCHPDHRFFYGKMIHRNQLNGYLIFELSEDNRTCFVHDVITSLTRDFPAILALFIVHCSSIENLESIRIVLCGNHPYRRKIVTSGFFPRKIQGVFQTYWNKDIVNKSSEWFVTSGDKDI